MQELTEKTFNFADIRFALQQVVEVRLLTLKFERQVGNKFEKNNFPGKVIIFCLNNKWFA